MLCSIFFSLHNNYYGRDLTSIRLPDAAFRFLETHFALVHLLANVFASRQNHSAGIHSLHQKVFLGQTGKKAADDGRLSS